MKYLWIVVILCAASAFGQNAYGPDFLNLHCTSPDPNSNTVFGIPPKAGLAPNASANGNIVIYCDASSNTLKASFNGSAYGSLVPYPLLVNLPPNQESQLSWNPGTIYPAILSGTCTFAAATTATCTYPTTFASAPQVQITPVNPGAVTFTLTAQNTANFTLAASASNSLTVNYSATLPQGANCTTNTFGLTGARQNIDFVAPQWPQGLLANVVGVMRVSNTDQIEVRICNPTAATVSFSSALIWGAKLYR